MIRSTRIRIKKKVKNKNQETMEATKKKGKRVIVTGDRYCNEQIE